MLNPYIAAQRAPFGKDLQDETLKKEVAAMLVSEDEENPVPVLEALFNRTLYMRSRGHDRSLHQMLHSGFYGPINRHRLPAFIHEIERDGHLRTKMYAAIDKVLSGSDVIVGHTDQGMKGDPGYDYEMARSHVYIGGEVFGDWGGGPGGYAGAGAWRHDFEANATEALQTALNKCGAHLDVDGVYGSGTLEAVKDFQRAHGLSVDGICGEDTWSQLNNSAAHAASQKEPPSKNGRRKRS